MAGGVLVVPWSLEVVSVDVLDVVVVVAEVVLDEGGRDDSSEWKK